MIAQIEISPRSDLLTKHPSLTLGTTPSLCSAQYSAEFRLSLFLAVLIVAKWVRLYFDNFIVLQLTVSLQITR